jgi:primosomal protein N' (replication factor Y)
MRVIVPFGVQTRLGYVIEIIEKSSDATKEIQEVLDAVPVVDEETFKLMDTIMDSAPSLLSAVFEAVIPSELLVSYHKEVHLLDSKNIDHELLEFFNTKGVWKLNQKDQIYYPKLKRLEQKGIISIDTVLKEKGSAKTEVSFTMNTEHNYAKISSYPIVMDLYLNKSVYTKKELLSFGVSASQMNTLLKHEVLIPDQTDVFRDIKHYFELEHKDITLTEEQLFAKMRILDSLGKTETFLLKGITGSGKTEVYLHIIEEVLKRGEQVLFLVPEITLIGPMAKRLKSVFDHVAIYHSALSKGERYDQYKMIQTMEARIVLGTRSAVFLPMKHLGLIIMDEEHDPSYEQLEGVIYDAKKIALTRSEFHQIPMILGSATPSIVSMYLAEQGTYQLLELTYRPLHLQLPQIKLIDMKDELKNKNTSIFSRDLLSAMKKRLEKKEQTILLFNRKGYAPFVLCRQCGDVPKCPHCDISLTYYKDQNSLKCHYCGYEKPFSITCDICKENAVKEVGAGIEYVEQVLRKTLPEAKILRMDANVTKTKGSHEMIWNAFQNEEADILLGTQMIAKGLDFPKVTLVGVLMADVSLKVPSYRASELAYMLFSQVTGRSGRFLPGEAIIQGYDLDHYAIKNVSTGYDAFYKEALFNRKISNYPPFMQNSQILVEGESYLKTYQQAFLLKKKLNLMGIKVLGPTEAFIKKIKDKYRFTITLKYEQMDFKNLFHLIESFEMKDISMRFYPSLDII